MAASDSLSILSFQFIVFPSDENAESLDEEANSGIITSIENMKDFDEIGGVEEK
jgi:hypothetical protein